MAFKNAGTWRERGLQLNRLKAKCVDILDALTVKEHDARHVGLVHFRQMCNTLAAVPIRLQQVAEQPGGVSILSAILGVAEPSQLKSCLTDVNKNAKCAFVTAVQFAFENMVEAILDALPYVNSPHRFAQSVRMLFDELQISDSACKYEIVCVPAWIRNTLHANGVHYRESKTVNLDGEKYVFKKGKRFSMAGWSHLFHAFECALEVHREVLLTPKLVAIEHIPSN